MRPAHVWRADFDRLCELACAGQLDEATIAAWAPPNDAEVESAQGGDSLLAHLEAHRMPPVVVPAWLRELSGITETARLVLPALLEHPDRVVWPVRTVCDRFGLVCRASGRMLDDEVRPALAELRRLRLVRGDQRALMPTRRSA